MSLMWRVKMCLKNRALFPLYVFASLKMGALINILLIWVEPVEGTTQFKNATEPDILKLPCKCVIPDELEVIDSQWLPRAGKGEQQGSSLGSLELQKWPASLVPGGMIVTDSLVFSHGPLNPRAKTPTWSLQKQGALLSSPVHRTPKAGPSGWAPGCLEMHEIQPQPHGGTAKPHFVLFLHNLQYTWASDMHCNGSFPHYREVLNLLSSRLYKAKIYEYKLHPVFFSFQSNLVERLTYP